MAEPLNGTEQKELLSERPALGAVNAAYLMPITDPTTGFTYKIPYATTKTYFNADFDTWDTLDSFYFTATPASTTTITTSIDTSAFFNIGDVIRVTQTDAKIRFCLVTNIAAALITINFEQLTADVATLEYKRGNGAGVVPNGRRIPNTDIYRRGETREERVAIIGGSDTPVSNLYGIDVYFGQEMRLTTGYIVGARASIYSLDTNAAETFEILADGTNQSLTFSCDALEIEQSTVDVDQLATDYNTPMVLNLTTVANNKDSEGVYWELLIYATND